MDENNTEKLFAFFAVCSRIMDKLQEIRKYEEAMKQRKNNIASNDKTSLQITPEVQSPPEL